MNRQSDALFPSEFPRVSLRVMQLIRDAATKNIAVSPTVLGETLNVVSLNDGIDVRSAATVVDLLASERQVIFTLRAIAATAEHMDPPTAGKHTSQLPEGWRPFYSSRALVNCGDDRHVVAFRETCAAIELVERQQAWELANRCDESDNIDDLVDQHHYAL